MLLRGFTTPGEYAQFVESDRAETDALFRDVLINVTSFFRDPDMFEDLKRDVFPQIVESGGDESAVRVWVSACSTGQGYRPTAGTLRRPRTRPGLTPVS